MTELLRIGVVGYSKGDFNQNLAERYLVEALDEIVRMNPDTQFEIVSGYTNMGVPAIAYAEAKKRGWKTVGFACSKVLSGNYDVFPCDEGFIIGHNWGDESHKFLLFCDVFVQLGGGDQARREVVQARKMWKRVLQYAL